MGWGECHQGDNICGHRRDNHQIGRMLHRIDHRWDLSRPCRTISSNERGSPCVNKCEDASKKLLAATRGHRCRGVPPPPASVWKQCGRGVDADHWLSPTHCLNLWCWPSVKSWTLFWLNIDTGRLSIFAAAWNLFLILREIIFKKMNGVLINGR